MSDDQGDDGKPDLRPVLAERLTDPERTHALSWMRWLDVPNELNFLQIAANAHCELAPRIEAVAALNELSCPAFIRLGAAAVLKALALKRNFHAAFKPPARANNPMWGIISGHQLYALSVAVPKERVRRRVRSPVCEPYAQLRAAVFSATSLLWMDERATFPHGFAVLVERAALGLRELRLRTSFLETLPAEPVFTADLIAILEQALVSASFDERTKLHIQAVCDLLSGTIRLTVPFLKPERTRPASTEDEGGSTATLVRYTSWSPADAKAAAASGLAPAEVLDGPSYLILDEAPSDSEWIDAVLPSAALPEPPRSIAELVLRRRHQLELLERNAQLMACGWHVLTQPEIAQVLMTIRDIRRQARAAPQDGGGAPERLADSAGVLTVMLWLAQPREVALGLVLFCSADDLPASGQLTGPGFILTTDEWVLPVVRPKGSPRYSNTDYSQADPVSPALRLPAPRSAVLALRHLAAVEHARQRGAAPAFVTVRSELQDILTEQLAKLSQCSSGRITANTIADAVLMRLIVEHRDLAAASVTTARAQRLSDTQLHYASFDVELLRARYAQLSQQIEDQAVAEATAQRGTARDPRLFAIEPFNAPSAKHGASPTYLEWPRVGCPIVPRRQTVQALIGQIRSACVEVKRAAGQPGFVIRHHNLLTLYTVALLKFATGYRDVRSPLPRDDEIDWNAEMLLVSDKDSASSANTRVLPLVGLLKAQLLAYARHRQVLASQLSAWQPTLANRLFAYPGPVGDEDAVSLKPLFFLEATGEGGPVRVIEVSGKTLKSQLDAAGAAFALPSNTNRSYLRANLIRVGCSPDSVDYLMGHWTHGREPLGRYAVRPVFEYIEELRRTVALLLSEDGWEVVEGLQ